jgi:hypothetical protein
LATPRRSLDLITDVNLTNVPIHHNSTLEHGSLIFLVALFYFFSYTRNCSLFPVGAQRITKDYTSAYWALQSY